MELKSDLSVAGIDKMLAQVTAYQKKIEALESEAPKELALYAAGQIADNLMGITDFDGNDPGKIAVSLKGNTAEAYNEGEQISFLEFGTGHYASAHPKAGEFGWEYGAGNKIFTTKGGRKMWRYYDKLRGHFRITAGNQPQMQVFRAAIATRLQVLPIVRRLMK